MRLSHAAYVIVYHMSSLPMHTCSIFFILGKVLGRPFWSQYLHFMDEELKSRVETLSKEMQLHDTPHRHHQCFLSTIPLPLKITRIIHHMPWHGFSCPCWSAGSIRLLLTMRIWVKVIHLKCAPRGNSEGYRRSWSKKRRELSKDMISG